MNPGDEALAARARETLRRVFGHAAFRDAQEAIVTHVAGSLKAGCSMGLTRGWIRGGPETLNKAWLSASEPPDVKTTWPGSHSRCSATERRAPSSAALASRP